MRRTVIRILVVLGCIASIAGGLLFEHHAPLGGALIVVGLVGTIYVFLDSDEKQRKTDEFAETTALLLTGAGLENPYTKMIQKELSRGGSHRYFLSKLETVLAGTPNDVDALYLYSIISALDLSLQQRLKPHVSLAGSLSYRHTMSIVERGISLGGDLSGFYSAKGILLDIAKRHSEARRCFRRSGEFRTDPYWRLLCSTSYGIECEFENSLRELQKATQEGAESSVTDWYYGRCFAAFGDYQDALNSLMRARRTRGDVYQLICDIQQCYWLSCRWRKSAWFSLLAGFIVLSRSRNAALRHFRDATVAIVLPMMMRAETVFSILSGKIPILRNTRLASLGNPAEPHLSMGLKLMKERRIIAATKMFAIAVGRSERLDAWLNYCSASLMTGDWDEAQRAYLYVFERWPQEIPEGYAAAIESRALPQIVTTQFDTL